jgi:peroxiredoxin
MRKAFIHILSIFCCLTMLTSCLHNSFSIKGDLRCVSASRAYLIHVNPVLNTVTIIDSSDIDQGHFSFKGKVNYPLACQIKLGRKTTINLMVENSDISITGSVQLPEEIKIRGSQSEDDFNQLVAAGNIIKQKKNDLWTQLIKPGNKPEEDVILKEKISKIEDSLLIVTQQFVEEHPKSVGAAYYVYYLLLDRQLEIKQLEPIIKLFDESIYGSEYVEYLRDEMTLCDNNLHVGNEAPNFKISKLTGDTLTLDSFRGKFLFINFTASWCPGRERRDRNLRAIYKIRQDTPFTIMSVYLDRNKQLLMDKLKCKKYPWALVSSFQYWESPITKYYDVNSIPYGVLISPDGKILKMNPSMMLLDSILQTYSKSELLKMNNNE